MKTGPTRSRLAFWALAALVAGLVLTAGCTAAPASQTPPGGGMMGGGGSEGMVAGVIATSRDAAMGTPRLDLGSGGIRVDRVLAPDDGWVLVRSTVPPGGVLGATRVRRGENLDVKVRLDALDGIDVRVALHVDRGQRGLLEFDPARPDRALDRPVLIDGRALESPLRLEGYGAHALPNSALVMVEAGRIRGGVLTADYLIVPGPSWVVVDAVEGGVPVRRVGLVSRPAGEWHELTVPVSGIGSATELAVTVYADRGAVGTFERRDRDPLGSADQPWVCADVVVSTRVTVR
ncbi:MAG: hypothetical protein Q7W16_02400 [Coriobacteriia bacterium]|nr:hypothetical protein [Coriobacteriia bacterium]